VRSIDTLVVGGGQAGLASSFHLARRGVDHVVVEAGRIGESWRSRRWDSFTLVTPSWMTALPDLPAGVGGTADPDGFLPRAEVVEMLTTWATAIAAPVHEGVAVTSVTRDPAGTGYVVETSDGPWGAHRVIVASGTNRTPRRPRFAADLPTSISQLDATAYRNPEALPPGAVLVVGSGQSGCQVVEDLRLAGRDVHLGVAKVPARGALDASEEVNSVAREPVKVDRVPAAGPGDVRVRRPATSRVRPLRLRQAGLAVPGPEDSDDYPGDDGFRVPQLRELDLGAAEITCVIWACGFAPDFSYLRLAVIADDGWPIHDGGITSEPGLGFVGLRFQTTAKSDLLFGVAADAGRVVDRLLDAGREVPR
jgi:putative flavoprotein involved in K+ transport